MKWILVLITCFIPIIGCSVVAEDLVKKVEATRVVDLTHQLGEDIPYWPGGIPFEMTRLVDYDKGYRLHKFSMGENTGTHLDAPSHFIKGNRSTNEIRLSSATMNR